MSRRVKAFSKLPSASIAGAILVMVSLLSACGGSSTEESMSSEFAFLDYPAQAGDCGLNYMYDQKFTTLRGGNYKSKTSDFKLIDKFPDLLEYDDSYDTWSSYWASESEPYEQERADALICKTWLDGLTTSTPSETEFPTAWGLIDEKISKLKTIVDERVLLIDEMYKLLPFRANDKAQRDKFYTLENSYEKGKSLAFEGHLIIRQILESEKSNGLDYWIATCPTYIQVTDLFGANVVTSENGELKIWNNTDEEKVFSGTVSFRNSDGVEVASQAINVTIPAGKSFDQKLEAIEGNDNYSGVVYPPKCTFTSP
jgi:hypothetical protein